MNLLRNIKIKELNSIEQQIIKHYYNEDKDNIMKENDILDYNITGLFVFNETPEGHEYWDKITIKEFKSDIESGKFKHIIGSNIHDNIDNLLNILNNVTEKV